MDLSTGVFAAFALGLITDILLKVADALYTRHPALLLQPHPTARPLLRRTALYLLATGMSFLMLRFTTPTVFISAWLPSLLILLIILTDYEQQLIFDRVLIGLSVIVLLFSPWIGATLINRAMAALLGGGVMLALSMISRGGIGGGDIKLLFTLGLWQGIDSLSFIFVFGFISGGIAAFFLLLSGKKKRRDSFAYGPYFAFGALLALLR